MAVNCQASGSINRGGFRARDVSSKYQAASVPVKILDTMVDWASAIVLFIYRVVVVEEVLTVITQRSVRAFSAGQTPIRRDEQRQTAHLGHHRRVNADIVVFNVVTVDFDRTFKRMLVGDGIAVRLHILEYAVANPFAESRPLAEPAVNIGSRGRRDDGGDFLVLAVRHFQAVLEVFLKPVNSASVYLE